MEAGVEWYEKLQLMYWPQQYKHLPRNDKMNEIQMKNNFYLNSKVTQVISITAEKMKASYWAELNI